MRADRFTALVDANVLAGALTRNLILSLAEDGFFRVRWSAEILDESERAITKMVVGRHPDPSAHASEQRRRIERAFPDAEVEGYEPLVAGLTLPDENDRHVLAAAIRTAAAVIVTDNIKDFPNDTLALFDIQRIGADDFVADVIDLDPVGSVTALRRMRQRFQRPGIDAEHLVRRIEAIGLTRTANLLLNELPNL
jgi:predicted nucleic acid-binding protein